MAPLDWTLDGRSLVIYRVLFPLVVVYDLSQRMWLASDFYCDTGAWPRFVALSMMDDWTWSFHLYSGHVMGQLVLAAFTVAVALCVVVGHYTRCSSVALWLLTVSLHNRTTSLNNFSDQMVRCCLLWGCFLPLGDWCSLDALHKYQQQTALRVKSSRWRHRSTASFLFLLQIAIVYWCTALLKRDTEWHSGDRGSSAIYFALSVDYYVTDMGSLMLGLPPWALQTLTRAVLAFEYVAPLGLFCQWRGGWIRAGTAFCLMAMHIGLGLCFHLGIFTAVFVTVQIAVLPGAVWDSVFPVDRAILVTLAAPPAQNPSPVLMGACMVCGVPPGCVKVVRSDSPQPLLTVAGGSRVSAHGWAALLSLSTMNPLGWALLLWARVGLRLRCMSAARFSRIFGGSARPVDLPAHADGADDGVCRVWHVASSLLASAMMVYVMLANVQTVTGVDAVPDSVQWVGSALQLDQEWAMFAPGPPRDDGWYVFQGFLGNGTIVDPFRGPGAPILWKKPNDVFASYTHVRWLCHLINIWTLMSSSDELPQREHVMDALCECLCTRWNNGQAAVGADPLTYVLSVKVNFMREHTLPFPKPPRLENWKLWTHTCANVPQAHAVAQPDTSARNIHSAGDAGVGQ